MRLEQLLKARTYSSSCSQAKRCRLELSSFLKPLSPTDSETSGSTVVTFTDLSRSTNTACGRAFCLLPKLQDLLLEAFVAINSLICNRGCSKSALCVQSNEASDLSKLKDSLCLGIACMGVLLPGIAGMNQMIWPELHTRKSCSAIKPVANAGTLLSGSDSTYKEALSRRQDASGLADKTPSSHERPPSVFDSVGQGLLLAEHTAASMPCGECKGCHLGLCTAPYSQGPCKMRVEAERLCGDLRTVTAISRQAAAVSALQHRVPALSSLGIARRNAANFTDGEVRGMCYTSAYMRQKSCASSSFALCSVLSHMMYPVLGLLTHSISGGRVLRLERFQAPDNFRPEALPDVNFNFLLTNRAAAFAVNQQQAWVPTALQLDPCCKGVFGAAPTACLGGPPQKALPSKCGESLYSSISNWEKQSRSFLGSQIVAMHQQK